jgi:hypothetical protein
MELAMQPDIPTTGIRRRSLCWTIWLAFFVGCAPAAPHGSLPPPSPDPPARPSTDVSSAKDVEPPTGCPRGAEREMWIAYYLGGHKAGYVHTQVRPEIIDGRKLVRIDWRHRLVVQRLGERVETGIEHTSHDTPDGQLVDFVETQRLGPSAVRTRGRVENDHLILETTSQGETRTTTAPWSKSNGGVLAMEFSLLARPLKPGQTRTRRVLMPTLHRAVAVELSAVGVEPTRMLSGTRRLLRVDCVVRFDDGRSYKGILWTDEGGDVLKTHLAAMQQETFRSTRSEALDESGLGEFDIMRSALVPVDRPIPNPHDTRRIRYRVRLAGEDPAGVFVVGPSQQLKPLADGSTELTVLSIRPNRPKQLPASSADAPTPDDSQPNSRIQSDDPAVRAMAEEAIRGKTDAWSKAVALEGHAHDAIREVSFSYALASAAEVAKTREGDCTEYAVLLAAMARAAGLPSRVAIGLVYLDRDDEPRHAFGLHMWTEIYVKDRWIPMDATLGRGGIGAAHLKLSNGSMKDANAMSCFMPVINVLGQLKIEVVEIE